MEEPFSPEETGAEDLREPAEDAAAPVAGTEAAPARPEKSKKDKKAIWKAAGAELFKAVAFLTAGALLTLVLVPNALIGGLHFSSASQKLSLLDQMIRAYYIDIDKVDDKTLSDGLAAGYIYALNDPYSAYLDADTYTKICYSNSGGGSGIGVDIVYVPDPDSMYVVRTVPGSPAEEAGLRKGDRIVAVEGETVTTANYNERLAAVRGESGTAVRLSVLREGKTLSLDVERRDFTACNVYARTVGDIGVIEITGFTAVTPGQFRTAVDDLLKQGVTGLIFDLRGNGGGLVDSTSKMLDYLLPKCEIGYAVYQGGKRLSLASSDADCVDLPMAVLMDGVTASAAEYFASALRDEVKAPLVGETSFGKGIMQTTYPLGDGSAVRLTVARFYTSSGTEFHNIGLKPDIAVSLPEGQNRYLLTDDQDPVLCAAIGALQ